MWSIPVIFFLIVDEWFKSRCFKIFLIYSSDDHLVRRSGTIWSILANGTLK